MDSETITKLLQGLADNSLLLIEPAGEVLQECTIEVHRKKTNSGKEVILFIAKAK